MTDNVADEGEVDPVARAVASVRKPNSLRVAESAFSKARDEGAALFEGRRQCIADRMRQTGIGAQATDSRIVVLTKQLDDAEQRAGQARRSLLDARQPYLAALRHALGPVRRDFAAAGIDAAAELLTALAGLSAADEAARGAGEIPGLDFQRLTYQIQLAIPALRQLAGQ